jgi:hypothetical protein
MRNALNRLTLVVYWLAVLAAIGLIIGGTVDSLPPPQQYDENSTEGWIIDSPGVPREDDSSGIQTTVTMPSGAAVRVGHPSGATEEQIIRYAQADDSTGELIVRGGPLPREPFDIELWLESVLFALLFVVGGWIFRFILVGDVTLYPPMSSKKKSEDSKKI